MLRWGGEVFFDEIRGVSYGFFLTIQGGRGAEIVVSPGFVVGTGLTPPGGNQSAECLGRNWRKRKIGGAGFRDRRVMNIWSAPA